MVVGASRDPDPGASIPAQATTSSAASTTVVTPTVVQVPQACLDSSELADEIISKLNRNERDNRLALALRDWSVATQQCRREAAATAGG